MNHATFSVLTKMFQNEIVLQVVVFFFKPTEHLLPDFHFLQEVIFHLKKSKRGLTATASLQYVNWSLNVTSWNRHGQNFFYYSFGSFRLYFFLPLGNRVHGQPGPLSSILCSWKAQQWSWMEECCCKFSHQAFKI